MSGQGCCDIAVAMLGARMAYAVPRSLHARGRLHRFYTDYFAGSMIRCLGVLPEILRPAVIDRAVARNAGGIPRHKVVSFNSFGVSYSRTISHAAGSARVDAYVSGGEQFSALVLKEMDWDIKGIYGFNSASLELFNAAADRGVKRVLEQTIVPYSVEASILAEERKRFPGWEQVAEDDSVERYTAREHEELRSADLVVCGSEFVRSHVARITGDESVCAVVPYGISSPAAPRERGGTNDRPLRVLFVGSLCLRKGVQYVADAARQLADKAEFRAVGPTRLSDSAMAKIVESIEYRGPVPRARMREHWDWADILLLPSLCEGSATVTYEALSAGLPVVCTAEAGSVVSDGKDGFIVKSGSADDVAEKIGRLASDRQVLESMSRSALSRQDELTMDAYGNRLENAIDRILA